MCHVIDKFFGSAGGKIYFSKSILKGWKDFWRVSNNLFTLLVFFLYVVWCMSRSFPLYSMFTQILEYMCGQIIQWIWSWHALNNVKKKPNKLNRLFWSYWKSFQPLCIFFEEYILPPGASRTEMVMLCLFLFMKNKKAERMKIL